MASDSARVPPDVSPAVVNRKIRQARAGLVAVCGADRHILNRKLNRIRHSKSDTGYPASALKHLTRLEKDITASARRRTARIQQRPAAVYPVTDLPILARKDEIIDAIKNNQVVIISGETGSGKTTQIPKFCLDAGRGIDGIIGCTQPRRIAATTVARRIAEEMGTELGQTVGYKIRFRNRTAPGGFIKIMTDGILLAEIQTDPFLNAYDTLIVDEAHERSLNIDLTLGLARRLLTRRRHMRLIVTSATIDTEKFSRAFNDAPIIEVSGRMFPVQVRYEAPDPSGSDVDTTYVDQAVAAADRILRQSRSGDMLVFIPTEQDIRDTCRMLEGRSRPGTTVLPLFARLTGPAQSRVFGRVAGRKIIVATNVAETSITIPGIRYVIDTGLARIPRYTPRSRCTLLPIDAISRSSADQRKGRCGRVADGICVRLYPENDYLSRPLFTAPEILRSNLADVILRMTALGLGNVADFPFIDPPAPRMIDDGYRLLRELGALRPAEKTRRKKKSSRRIRLTADGRIMARLPVDPRLSRMLIEAGRRGCVAEILIIAAALSIQDPRERPMEMRKEADRAHAVWTDPQSDFITRLNIWRWFEAGLAEGRGSGRMKRYCRQHFLSYRRMREWRDIHRQLGRMLMESGIRAGALPGAEVLAPDGKNHFSPRYAAVHQSILSGFLSNIACRKEKNSFTATRGREVMIFPGSGLFDQAGKWIVSAEIVQTSQLFARINANIDPGWLEPLAGDLCRLTWRAPRWDRKKETVMGVEQVSLFGLVIVAGRPVVYGRIDEKTAADVFIEEALVAGDIMRPPPFLRHNQRQVQTVCNLENRLRRRDIFVGSQALAAFYSSRLEGVWNMRLLRQQIKARGSDRFLRIHRSDLIRYSPDTERLAAYPDTVCWGGNVYPCTYAYAPGDAVDGITVTIPAGMAASVPVSAPDWLVPGFIAEKIQTLIRGLPKTIRRQLGPAPRVVESMLADIPATFENEPLVNTLGRLLHQRFGVHVSAGMWPTDVLPDYLKMRIVITDSSGREIGSSRDPSILHRLAAGGGDTRQLNILKKQLERTGLDRWDFGDVPAVMEQTIDEVPVVGYPGLTVETGPAGPVSLRVYPHRTRALAAHLDGVRKLATLHLAGEMKFLRKWLSLPAGAVSKTATRKEIAEVERQLFEKVVTHFFARNIRTEKAFATCLDTARPQLHDAGNALKAAVLPVLKDIAATCQGLTGLNRRHGAQPALQTFIDQRRKDLERLVPSTWITIYDAEHYARLPVYLRSILIRTQRAVLDLEKDRRKAETVRPFADYLDRLLTTLSPATSDDKRHAVEEFFWLLEDFKVSVFAQELRLPRSVSAKRLQKKQAEIERIT